MNTRIIKHVLQFKVPSGTSRGVLTDKPSWFIISEEGGELKGISECSLIKGLSPDDPDCVEEVLGKAVFHGESVPANFPAANFAIEMWKKSLASTEVYDQYPSTWSQGELGVPINGLIWMGSPSDMKQQIKMKLDQGYDCIKMKIGAIDFEQEYEVLRHLRKAYSRDDITIRVDANGAFSPSEALEKLKRLADLDIHSIEQPIKQGQWEEMAALCESSPLDIALDEELIGITDPDDRLRLLDTIRPPYIILKPSLLGGIAASEDWITKAESQGIGWWVTSALESNIGLNALAAWTATLDVNMPQGLGTGGLFTNNTESPLYISKGHIWYHPEETWDISMIRDEA